MSLLLLVIVLTVAMTMLFQMRAFAERQQFYMLPRQTARRAADYLSYYVAGASDLNDRTTPRTSPDALIMYYDLGGVTVQASYDNLTGGEPGNAITAAGVSTKFGDIGTDVLTLVAPTNPAKYLVSPPFPALGSSVNLFFNFRGGCATNDTANQDAFKAATGFDGTQSALLTLLDRNGNWIYFRIPAAGYLTDGLCSDTTTFQNIHVQADTQSAAASRASERHGEPRGPRLARHGHPGHLLPDPDGSRGQRPEAPAEARPLRPGDRQPGDRVRERHGERRGPAGRLRLRDRARGRHGDVLEHVDPDDR